MEVVLAVRLVMCKSLALLLAVRSVTSDSIPLLLAVRFKTSADRETFSSCRLASSKVTFTTAFRYGSHS